MLLVADGLGSSAEAALASRYAIAVASRVLEATAAGDHSLAVQRDGTRDAIAAARDGVRQLAKGLGLGVESVGTTLLVCVCTPSGTTFGGVGDGFLGVRAHDAAGRPRHHLLTLEPPSTFANEVGTLGGFNDLVVEAILDPEVDGLALATDGYEPAAIDRPTAPNRTLRTGVVDALLRHADAALDSTELHRQALDEAWDDASADDRTIVLAVRR